ncbi:unnamed protein product [Closterium sp. Yama58-4]|nr:unnamed protein product [Closterium sp. Yama58-4]
MEELCLGKLAKLRTSCTVKRFKICSSQLGTSLLEAGIKHCTVSVRRLGACGSTLLPHCWADRVSPSTVYHHFAPVTMSQQEQPLPSSASGAEGADVDESGVAQSPSSANPAAPSFASSSLYVGDLDASVTEAQLFDLFSQVGPVASIRVCRDMVTRQSLGYSYVNFSSSQDAARALDLLNFTNVAGRPMRIMFSHRDPSIRRSGTGNIFIKNLDKSIDNKALYDTFAAFGSILSCRVATDDSGASKGFAFVQFEKEEVAKAAIEKVNGMLIAGKQVFVGPFVRKQDRSSNDSDGMGGGGGGGDRSGNNQQQQQYTNLYVKGLGEETTDEELLKVFLAFGAIKSAVVMREADGRSKGFGFVNFEKAEDAAKAVEGVNGRRVVKGVVVGGGEGEGKGGEGEEAGKEGGKEGEEGEKGGEKETKEGETKEGETKEEETKEGEKEGDKKEGGKKEGKKGGGGVGRVWYVARAQKKAEREAELKRRYEEERRQQTERYSQRNLYFKNLEESVDEGELKNMFQEYGAVTSCKILKHETGGSKGAGFVLFANEADAAKALAALNSKMVKGKPLYVAVAQPKAERQAQLQAMFQQQRGGQPHPRGGVAGVPGAAGGYYAPPGVVAQQGGFYTQPGMMPVQPPYPYSQQPMRPGMVLPAGMGGAPGMAGGMGAPGMVPGGAQGMVGGPNPNVYMRQQQQYGAAQGAPVQVRGRAVGVRAAGIGGAPGMAGGMGAPGMVPGAAQGMVGGPNPNVYMRQQQQYGAAQGAPVQILGEQLYPLVARQEPEHAGKIKGLPAPPALLKITGMLLEMDKGELLMLLPLPSLPIPSPPSLFLPALPAPPCPPCCPCPSVPLNPEPLTLSIQILGKQLYPLVAPQPSYCKSEGNRPAMAAIAKCAVPSFTGLRKNQTSQASTKASSQQNVKAKAFTVRAVAEPAAKKLTIEEAEARVVAGNPPPAPAPKPRPAAPKGTPIVEPLNLISRPRRNRRSPFLREAFQETFVTPANFILPLFIHEGVDPSPIGSMPGCYRLGWNTGLIEEVYKARDVGVNQVVLFPKVPDALKTPTADEAYNPDGIVPRSIRLLKDKFPDLIIYTDVALDPYNSDGHDGIVREDGVIMNDETVHQLCLQAVAQARAGADVVSPSDMMDGRVGAIRAALDEEGFNEVSIMSYTAKYASAFYGPFREALDSNPRFGDKKTYQMNPGNYREALIETHADESEGADILMVKPAMPYLDVIRLLRDNTALPISAYQVSGEYAMIKAAAANGWLDEKKAVLESLLCIKRAGADIILTYFAIQAAQYLAGERK